MDNFVTDEDGEIANPRAGGVWIGQGALTMTRYIVRSNVLVGFTFCLYPSPAQAKGAGFEDRSAGIRHHSSEVPVPGDLDLDGDLDLWSPGRFHDTRILWNVERQIARHRWPQVGSPLVFDVRGTPGTAFGLWASVQPPATNAVGAFRLDPLATTLVHTSTLDATGRSLPQIELPAELSLLGQELHWQALIGSPHRWSNVERTVLAPR